MLLSRLPDGDMENEYMSLMTIRLLLSVEVLSGHERTLDISTVLQVITATHTTEGVQLQVERGLCKIQHWILTDDAKNFEATSNGVYKESWKHNKRKLLFIPINL